jgi:chemotaxis protein CheD
MLIGNRRNIPVTGGFFIMDIKNNKQYYLMSGSIFVPEEAYLVMTVLGSCVSVCLWDSVKKIGGINHYMLPFWNGEGLASPKYGTIAIPKLLEKMIGLGAVKRNLQAKIFGGGEVFGKPNAVMNIGARNILIAQSVLEREHIPIVSADVGGKTGRKIVYDLVTGSVFVKKLNTQIDDIKV